MPTYRGDEPQLLRDLATKARSAATDVDALRPKLHNVPSPQFEGGKADMIGATW